ncbi:histone H2B-like [Carcharodon carcharias]|uniref:histone H2B-like n=1 Tax=Carcharodon carcharias TaxID=13397 RepID=UPI001B7D9F06|nr:histone H2B-like [Carcharodon carcharias]
MPEVAAMAKGGASCKMSKQSLAKVTKKSPKKQRKSRQQSYSTHVYRLLTQVHPSTRILSKAVSVTNSFVVNVFEHVASEDSHLIHYKRHTISASEIPSAIHLLLPGELAKHAVSKCTRAITKIHQLCLGRSF